MADIPARTEMRVTTGPLRGSRKIHVGDRKVAMREIDLEGGEPPVRVYDTSGPYIAPDVHIDIMAGLPQLRRDGSLERGDGEGHDAGTGKCDDTARHGTRRLDESEPLQNTGQRPS